MRFEKLTLQRFQEILIYTYLKGIFSENIQINDFIEEIKLQFLGEIISGDDRKNEKIF